MAPRWRRDLPPHDAGPEGVDEVHDEAIREDLRKILRRKHGEDLNPIQLLWRDCPDTQERLERIDAAIAVVDSVINDDPAGQQETYRVVDDAIGEAASDALVGMRRDGLTYPEARERLREVRRLMETGSSDA